MGLGEDQCTDAWISPHDVQADGPTHLIMETRILVCTHRSMQTTPSLDSRLLEDAEEVYRRQGDPDASGAVSEADISLEMPKSTCSLWHNV
jgi:hypothetical protein